MPDRVGRVRAVVQQLVEAREAAELDVHPERGEQPAEGLDRESRTRAPSPRARRRSGGAGRRRSTPRARAPRRRGRRARARAIGLLVGEVVGGAREGVERRDVPAQMARQQARAEREVLVVVRAMRSHSANASVTVGGSPADAIRPDAEGTRPRSSARFRSHAHLQARTAVFPFSRSAAAPALPGA